MDISAFLKQMTFSRVFYAAAGFLALCAPGVLLIRIYWPHEFASLDFAKLVLLALSLALPLVALRTFVIAHIASTRYFPEETKLEFWTRVVMMHCIFAYCYILIGYLFRLPFRRLVVVMLLVEGVIIAVTSVLHWLKKPNQTPEPTTMAVTPPAAQEPRQP